MTVITAVIIFAPVGGDSRTARMVKVVVVAICWVFAVLAFTRLRRTVGEKRVLPEKVSRAIIIILLVLFLLALYWTAFALGRGGIAGVVVTALAAYMVWQVLKEVVKAGKKRRRQSDDEPD